MNEWTSKRLHPDSIRDSIRIRIVAADSIRYSIRTKISDSQVPSLLRENLRFSFTQRTQPTRATQAIAFEWKPGFSQNPAVDCH